MNKPPLIVIAGPTASGKTSLSVECALKFNGEIISADSMQIYKGMDIATAKPTEAEKKGVPHHLMGFLETDKSYSVAQFVADAKTAAEEITHKNKLPIICGGTGLYIDSFVNNTKFSDADTDEMLRLELNREFDEKGADAMLDMLRSFDPETADNLHPSNKKRIVRAIEVYRLTGKTFSQTVLHSRNEPLPYNVLYIFMNYRNRDTLYERVNKRVDIMLENGLVNEAKQYFSLENTKTAAQAIGYKELKPWLDGEMQFEQAVTNLKQSTRHYAKRQITWFNKTDNTIRVYPDDYESEQQFYDCIYKLIERVV